MKRGIPLYVKWLSGFFLNLVLLGVGFAFVFTSWLPVPFSRLLISLSRDRIDAAVRLLAAELGQQKPDAWNATLDRFGKVYGARFCLYDYDGKLTAGEGVALPSEVTEQMPRLPWVRMHLHRLYRQSGGREGVPMPGERDGAPGSPGSATNAPAAGREEAARPAGPEPGLPQKPGEGPSRDSGRDLFGPRGPRDGGSPPWFMNPFAPVVFTEHPTRYWLLRRLQIGEADEEEGTEPVRATLLIVARHLTGGLFVDYRVLVSMVMGAVGLSLLLWLPFVRRITVAITQITRASHRIALGRFDTRVDLRRRDELGELGRTINHMAAQLDGLVGGQKRFLGDVAHELCSPVARLQVALGILEQRATPEQASYVRSACEKSQQIADLVNELLSFSRASFGEQAVKREPVPLKAVVAQAIAREAVAGSDVRADIPGELAVLADPSLLLRALTNLLRNAVNYAGRDGPITVSASSTNGTVSVAVADSGPGVPAEHLHRLFEPFYRVDASRDRNTGGVGLGLTIVKTCVESCGGSVTVFNRDPKGLEVCIRLQRAPSGAAEGEAGGSTPG